MRKRNVLCILIAIFMILSSVPVGISAATSQAAEVSAEREVAATGKYYSDDDFFYEIIDGEAEVDDYLGSATEVTIPAQVDGYPVTSIGDYAFSSCYGLTSVTIPEGVENIGLGTFYHCQSLTSITIPASVKSIGNSAFRGCTSLENIIISEGVEHIGIESFCYCESLTSITIPASVKSIGSGAFDSCRSLESITISEGVESMGDYAFSRCYSLTGITIPESVTSVSNGVFMYCYGLTSITIPDSVKSIGAEAFYWCDSLESIIIPASVKSIGDQSFSNCKRLKNITISEGVESIGVCAFFNCSSLTGITIPASVKNIGYNAFQGCSGITNITIPEGVESIDDGVFADCEGLVSITIPDSVKSIGDQAFQSCKRLKNITIPEGVTSIGVCAFFNCYSLQSITIPEGVKSISKCAFANCDSLTSIIIPVSVKSIGDSAFWHCDSLVSITIPETVESIGFEVFNYCDCLTDVYFIGTQEKWKEIEMGESNWDLWFANIHFQPEVEFVGSSVTLHGDLGVNFYMEVPDEVLSDEDATVIFTYSGKTESVPASSGEQTDYGYKYTCNIPAKDMLTEVTCTIESYNGTQSTAFTYTVKEYAETILSNPKIYGEEAVALVKSMLNYGAAAQKYFGYNTDNLANDSVYMTQEDKAVPEKDFSNLSYDLTQGKEVQYYGTALNLKSEVGIKHYFTLSEGVNPDDVVVTVDGTQTNLVKNGNLYMVEIPDIAVHKLYTKFEVKVGDTTISYCVMDYAKTAQDAGKQDLLKVMFALDVFAQNAVAYKG